MCGIVGNINKSLVKNNLIEGLKKLEYRGYDSVGIALVNNNTSKYIKIISKHINESARSYDICLARSYDLRSCFWMAMLNTKLGWIFFIIWSIKIRI